MSTHSTQSTRYPKRGGWERGASEAHGSTALAVAAKTALYMHATVISGF